MLDFDFEKLCSVSLSRINVYACLVCGKYFQGKWRTTKCMFDIISEDLSIQELYRNKLNDYIDLWGTLNLEPIL